MDSVTAVRSLKPATQMPRSPQAGHQPGPAREAAAPVAPPLRPDAVVQLAGPAAMIASRLGERDEGRHPASEARAAADAARKAYIKASIAAGISPLPLP